MKTSTFNENIRVIKTFFFNNSYEDYKTPHLEREILF